MDYKRDMARLRKAANAARDFPKNTCPASRHLHLIADALSRGKPYPMLQEEPEHCASSMLLLLAELWRYRSKDRARTARIKREVKLIEAGKNVVRLPKPKAKP